MIIKYAKIHENAMTPTRGHASDAGLDVYFCRSEEDLNSLGNGTTIRPNESARFGTGLRFAVPEAHMLQVMNRSGMAAKHDLVVGACVVDAGYDGEVFVDLHNIGREAKVVKVGDKIAQVVLIPVVVANPVEVTQKEISDANSELSARGEGALGSTGM